MLQRMWSAARRTPRQRGQAMVEASMVFLSAAVLLCGMFDLGRAFYYNIAVANAVREGARLAIDTSRTNTEIQAAVTDAAPSIALTNITVSPTTRTTSNSGQTVTVTATHNFTVLTPVISSVLGNPFAITRSAQIMMF
jgi:Flp pilus assembly protein TadG